MEKHYIIFNGNKYRVEFNINSMAHFEDISGMDFGEFSQRASENKINVRQLRAMAYCAIVEGERCDNRKFNVNELDFGAMLRPGSIEEIVNIYKRQGTVKKNKLMSFLKKTMKNPSTSQHSG